MRHAVLRVFRHFKQYSLIYPGLVIYLLFFISVARTGWFDIFFSGAALHDGAKGIDFYQIVKGAWSFWHGGTLVGDHLPARSPWNQYFSNGNVYHPLFTLTLGSFLAWFDPARSPYVWLWIKLPVSLLVIGYFFWSFRTSKYINFAVFILLANFSVYLELAAWQFQFVLNMFLLLFFTTIIKKKSYLLNSLLYWLGMLVKPVGLLFVPVLCFKGQWRTALLGVGLFLASTFIFLIHRAGNYYIDNLFATFTATGTAGPNQIITFSALLHFSTHWPAIVYQAIQNVTLAMVIFLSALKRIPIAKSFLLYIAYYLCFYSSVFEYQWSTLAYVVAVCIVTCPEFQTRTSRVYILLICLPDCFFILNYLHIDIHNMGYLGLIPGETAWKWMTISKLIPLFLLLMNVLSADIKPIFDQMKAFWSAMRKVNDQLKVFGTQEEEAPAPVLAPEFALTYEPDKESDPAV
jgi:hypothetical protein